MEFSSGMYLGAFIGYLLSSISYVIGVTGRKMKIFKGESKQNVWTKWGYIIAILGVLSQLVGMITRWIASGHAPVSNMYEYMSFWSFTIMLAFVLISGFYRVAILGAFAVPVGLIVIAYASVFPHEATPLIPALQSYWLYIHVTTAALGEGVLTIAFAAAFMHLLVVTDVTRWDRRAQYLEFVMYLFFLLVGFVVISLYYKIQGYQLVEPITQTLYTLPPLLGPTGVDHGSLGSLLGISLPLVTLPTSLTSFLSSSKINTFLWTLVMGSIIYAIVRLISKRPIISRLSTWVKGLDAPALDELSYRAIAIGYPIFTLGAIVFAMIWAQEAWGSYWSWDPKETWALITFLYYTLYLHLRLQRGWEGAKASWMAVAGFVVILFLLVGVNFIIVGLHSYATP